MPKWISLLNHKKTEISQEKRFIFAKVKETPKKTKKEKKEVNNTSVNTHPNCGVYNSPGSITKFKKRAEKLMEQSENCWIIDRERERGREWRRRPLYAKLG